MNFNALVFDITTIMRYDTPGDWILETLGLSGVERLRVTAWAGLGELSARAVQLHEFVEAVILLEAGIDPEEVDVLDDYKIKSRLFARGELQSNLLIEACRAAEAIPVEKRNLYAQAHALALLVERMFVEAGGGNWQEHDAKIEASRGKIPFEE